MDTISLHDILKLIAAMGFVLALMGGLALAIKKFGFMQGLSGLPGAPRRLKVVESLALDPRRRAILLRCDDKDHLVILGPSGETVVKADLNPMEEKT